MPGPVIERPRAYKLNDIEPQHHHHNAKNFGGGRSAGSEDSSSPLSSGSNMGSIARFPKLDECAHFHYEHVELGSLEIAINDEPQQPQDSISASNQEAGNESFSVRVTSGDACWTLQRSYENFVLFDQQLHRCIFDRKFSDLPELPEDSLEAPGDLGELLRDYMTRFSRLNHDGLNCGPVLNWLQIDNRGRRILVPEADSCPINTPAVAAAYAVRPYQAQAQDEISFQVGDMISVIDMPPPGESIWWRGKNGFAVGFFPVDCVAVIGDKVPRHLALQHQGSQHCKRNAGGTAGGGLQQPVKPVLRKHGKLIAFFRSFILNRPSRRRLKQSGILKERVFGCDLGEHLLNSGQEVPTVLTCCAEFIEKYGLVDGIYRLSGVSSNIQKLRHAFDEDRVPALNSDQVILQDIHSVASLLKMYFRELPNPLCTYQLYSTFVGAVQSKTDAEKLKKMRDAVRKLPPPHYRTLEYLMRHLVRVAARGNDTGMTPRNVAIVWAPNLLRCKELEVGGVAALQGVGVQAVVTEFLICFADLIFGESALGRPKSLAITTPAKLLSLEEARNRSFRGEPNYIQVGAGPDGLPLQYHTVIELPRKRNGSKRSPSLNWRALFGKGGPGARAKSRPVGTPPQNETAPNSTNSLRRLRPVKSADSLDGEDSLGPLLGPPPSRTCGHSRSVSHDSYFDHLGDNASNPSPLDLSEIQLNFDLEEREMRMLSEEECTGAASAEVSPRRQRADGSQSSNAINGGSKRKRSRLEERLQCDVELRFIDSQSPDQVMVSADVHEMETPSSLPTPGYHPLISEASTPLTPATVRGTPLLMTSPSTAATSPRISFRSLTLPLEITQDDLKEENSMSEKSNGNRRSLSTDQPSKNNDVHHQYQNVPMSVSFSYSNKSSSSLRDQPSDAKYERLIESLENTQKQTGSNSHEESKTIISEIIDHEMTPCEKAEEILPDICESSHAKSLDNTTCKESSDALSYYLDSKPISNIDNLPSHQEDDTTSPIDIGAGISNGQGNDTTGIPLSSLTDFDSPMSCEQTCDDLPDSGFVICDTSDKIYTNSETNSLTCTGNGTSTPDWFAAEKTIGSVSSPISESNGLNSSGEDTINPAIAENLPMNSEKCSRTSLDLTMCSTLETDTSCLGTSDSISSSILNSSADVMFPNANENQDSNSIDGRESSINNPISQRSSKLFSNENLDNQRISNVKRFSNHQCDQSNQSRSCDSILSSNNHNHSSNQNQINNSASEFLSDNGNKNSFKPSEFFNGKELLHGKEISYHEKQKNDKRNSHDNSKKLDDGNRFNRNSRLFNYYECNLPKEQNNDLPNIPNYECDTSQNVESREIQNDVDVIVPSETAAAVPQEMAHIPETSSPTSERAVSNPTSPKKDVGVSLDTATILQELALQRLSGGVDLPSPTRRRLDSDKDSRSFDSEIGREIVRQNKLRQELEHARVKSDESPTSPTHGSNQYLPPCLRARHARSTRAALSRSLDEGKFNKMTSESLLTKKQSLDNDSTQHGSTPNVGCNQGTSLSNSHLSRSMQSKNLGLDLDDPRCRERIEKYKQERRTMLRDKFKSEAFRGDGASGTVNATGSSSSSVNAGKVDEDGEQALLARLKQRASRPPLH